MLLQLLLSTVSPPALPALWLTDMYNVSDEEEEEEWESFQVQLDPRTPSPSRPLALGFPIVLCSTAVQAGVGFRAARVRACPLHPDGGGGGSGGRETEAEAGPVSAEEPERCC